MTSHQVDDEQSTTFVVDVTAPARAAAARLLIEPLTQLLRNDRELGLPARIEAWWFADEDLQHIDRNDRSPLRERDERTGALEYTAHGPAAAPLLRDERPGEQRLLVVVDSYDVDEVAAARRTADALRAVLDRHQRPEVVGYVALEHPLLGGGRDLVHGTPRAQRQVLERLAAATTAQHRDPTQPLDAPRARAMSEARSTIRP